VPVGQKTPVLPAWPKLRLTETDLSDHFSGPSNLGILNGAPSGNQVDVDLDCPEALVVAHVWLPPTNSVFGRPGKPRSHRLYMADPLPATKQFQDPDGTMLLEVRSTGSQTLFPPSMHPNGEHLRWDEDGDPGDVSGDALLAHAGRTATACLLARHWPAAGSRHDAALALAGGLLRLDWRVEEVTDFIGWVARVANDEEWRDRGASVMTTAQRLATGNSATGWPHLAELVGPTVVDRVREWLGAPNSEDSEHCEGTWELPIPLTEPSLPPFPTEIFPNWVRAYVEAVAVATQTPPDLAAMLVLDCLAIACAKRVIVQITPDWPEPVNLFTAVAMAPAERKSAVFREVTQPIMEFEAAEIARLAPGIAEAASRRKIAERALEKAQRDEATGSNTWEQGTFLSRTDELARELAAMKVPASPRFVADDCSPERLASLLAEQGGRIAVMAPEGDVFDLIARRYSATGMPNFGAYLRGHAGDDLRVDRVNRPPEFVRSSALTIGLAIQPEIIHGLAMRPGFRGRGLLGWFLYGLPASMLGRRAVSPPVVSDALRRAYHRQLATLSSWNRALPETAGGSRNRGTSR
jgi:hypothetical protein